MIYRTLLVTALLLPFAVGHAVAHGACAHGEDAATAVGPLYVTATPGLFQESNDHPGLQSAGGSCEDDNGRLVRWDADTKIL